MLLRISILLSALLFLFHPAYADFPFTTHQLGEPGAEGGDGYFGYVGLAGLGGIPSGDASVRNGMNGGTGGRGGTGGAGGQGGIGRWDIYAYFAYAHSRTIYVGGATGNPGNVGSQGSFGGTGGDGGFANWPGFMPGEDGEGWGGGAGSVVTGTNGGNGIEDGGGGGGGSSGPNGFVQQMSNGGNGHGENAGTGYGGYTGGQGMAQMQAITSDGYIDADLRIGGNGGNGGPGGYGGYGGGGGGGAGGGGAWPAGDGGSGGSGGPGGYGGPGGPPGGGSFIIQENGGYFDSSGTTYIRSNGGLYIYGTYRVYVMGSIVNYYRLWVDGGTLINYETITNYADFKNTNSGIVTNYGTINGNLSSSGVYEGMGLLNGTLTNTGVVAPGYDVTPGITTVENLNTSDGTIQITLTGHDYEAWDQLQVTGSLTLAGATLQPEFLDGFGESSMTHGDGFVIIRYQNSISDEFGGIDDALAPLTQGEWELEYNRDLGDGWHGIRLVYGSGLSAAEDSDLPEVYCLNSVHPNPFNPMTTVQYALPEAGHVTFRIYDLAGRLVWSRQEDAMPAGRHEFVWRGTDSNGQSLASGSYVLRMSARGYVSSKKVMLVR